MVHRHHVELVGAGRADGSQPAAVIFHGEVEVSVTYLEGRPDLLLIDELLRLRLAVGRRGCSVVLRHPCPRLLELLELLGVIDLFARTPASAREMGREAEGDEELRVEEVVQPGDPPA